MRQSDQGWRRAQARLNGYAPGMRTHRGCSGVAQPLALTSDELTHLRVYGGRCGQHVNTAKRPVVRGVSAHQVTQSSDGSALP